MTPEFRDRRTVLRLGGTALATIGSAGCLSGRSSSVRTVEMTAGFGFDPEVVAVETGATVRWTNESGVDHTVTAYEADLPDGAAYFASGDFESERAARTHVTEGLVAPGGDYEHTFERSGEYEYYCIPHEGSGMVGTVRVD